jgi:hypothetical protein
VLDEITAFRRREETDRDGDQIADMVEGPGTRSPDERLQLREGLFDWIEIRTVGRQEAELSADGFDRCAHRWLFVDGEIIEDDHIAGAERGHEDLLDVGEKRRIVDRPVENGRRGEAVEAQRRDHGVRLPMTARRVIAKACAARTAAVPTQQIRRNPAFVQKQILWHVADRLPRLPLPPGRRDIRATLLVGVYRFLRNSLRRGRGRHQREAEALRATMEAVDHPLPVTFFIEGSAGVRVRQAESESPIEKNRQFPSGGGHGLGFARAGREAAIERAEGRLRFADVHRRRPEQGGRTIRRPARPRAQEASSRDFVGWGEAQPRREVFGCWPLRHVIPAFGHEAHHGVRPKAVNLAEISSQ